MQRFRDVWIGVFGKGKVSVGRDVRKRFPRREQTVAWRWCSGYRRPADFMGPSNLVQELEGKLLEILNCRLPFPSEL